MISVCKVFIMNKLIWIVIILMWLLWAGDYFYFRHQGARFTALHGQELCLRVQSLDGKPCHYAP